jgi:hypothetical protein
VEALATTQSSRGVRHEDYDTIVVPQVPRPSLLTPEDFSHSLSLASQPHVVLPRYKTLRVGDIEIEVLPFFGEQPTRRGPSMPEGFRNWGNCYRISCPTFSALILADSGEDPMGRMSDVARNVVDKSGPVDVVMNPVDTSVQRVPYLGENGAQIPEYTGQPEHHRLQRIGSILGKLLVCID